MIFPLLGVFLTEDLKANAGFLGILEGAADTTASLLKLASGWISDHVKKRKSLVLTGYGIASAVRPLVAFASAPWHVLVVRLTDRVGKGIRGAPRDALIADAANPKTIGRAFGFHRAMDHAGAVVGSTAAAILVALHMERRHIFLVAAVPGVIATLLLFFVKEKPREPTAPRAKGTRAALPGSLKSYLGILLLFSIGNSSDAFLLIRAYELGVTNAPLLWTVLNISKLVWSYLGGDISDRVPRPILIAVGWLVFAITYVGLALASASWHAWALFVLYGTYYGLTEPAEKALVKDLAPEAVRGRAYGAYNFIVGVTALPAGILTGALWRIYGGTVALAMGAAVALASGALLIVWRARQS
jgi:MFS family permease